MWHNLWFVNKSISTRNGCAIKVVDKFYTHATAKTYLFCHFRAPSLSIRTHTHTHTNHLIVSLHRGAERKKHTTTKYTECTQRLTECPHQKPNSYLTGLKSTKNGLEPVFLCLIVYCCVWHFLFRFWRVSCSYVRWLLLLFCVVVASLKICVIRSDFNGFESSFAVYPVSFVSLLCAFVIIYYHLHRMWHIRHNVCTPKTIYSWRPCLYCHSLTLSTAIIILKMCALRTHNSLNNE